MTTDSRGKSPAQTTSIVIFGASGDLTRRKLIPSLCSLFGKGRLGPEVQIVGVARSVLTDQEFRDSLTQDIESFEGFRPDPQEWAEFASRIHYCRGDVSSPGDLKGLEETLRSVESPGKPANRLYYLALAPFLYGPAILILGSTGMAREEECWRRVSS